MGGDRSARWARDPSGRHQHRFWDGTAWTEYVSDRGRSSLDPFPLADAPPADAAAPTPGSGTATTLVTAPPATPPAQRPASSPVSAATATALAIAPATTPAPAALALAPSPSASPVAAPRSSPEAVPGQVTAEGDAIAFAGHRPVRGPHQLPSHRARPGTVRRVTPSLALAASVVAAGWAALSHVL